MRRTEPPDGLRGRAALTSELVASGVARSRLRHADVTRPHRGVAGFGVPDRDVLDRCAAYEPIMLPGQFFSHATAAALWGMWLPEGVPELLDVAVLDPRTPPRRPGIAGRRVSRVELGFVHGFAVVSAADAWCQLGAVVARDNLVAAGDSALPAAHRSGAASLDAIANAAVRHRGTPGAARAAEALGLLRPGVESRPETLLRLALRRARLPEPVVAAAVTLPDGRSYHPDLSYPELRIAIEYEGDGHRTDRRQWERDVERYERFADAGWRVIRVTATQLFRDARAVAARVRAAIRAARSAPPARRAGSH